MDNKLSTAILHTVFERPLAEGTDRNSVKDKNFQYLLLESSHEKEYSLRAQLKSSLLLNALHATVLDALCFSKTAMQKVHKRILSHCLNFLMEALGVRGYDAIKMPQVIGVE